MRTISRFNVSYLAMCSLMTSCMYGENKAFFDETNTSTVGDTPALAGAGGSSNPVTPVTGITPTPTLAPPVICDPLGGGGGAALANNGIKASLFYFNNSERGAATTTQVSDYFNFGHKANADFYFNSVNVPTKYFGQGFQMPDGSSIQDADGNILLENFAFDFKTSIKLPPGSGLKKKQFAILADDGANLMVQDPISGTWSKNVNNDGLHSTRLGCATTSVSVSSEFSTPIELQYYQGPRYYIAVMLLWRDWNGDPNESYCGTGGDSSFFDSSTVPSIGNANWQNLMTRWEVVPADVMYLEAKAVNPCQ